MIRLMYYSNRKLYRPASKRLRRPGQYVNLDRVAELVQAGRAVRITDHETGSDLTAQMLALAVAQRGVGPVVIRGLRRLLRATR